MTAASPTAGSSTARRIAATSAPPRATPRRRRRSARPPPACRCRRWRRWRRARARFRRSPARRDREHTDADAEHRQHRPHPVSPEVPRGHRDDGAPAAKPASRRPPFAESTATPAPPTLRSPPTLRPLRLSAPLRLSPPLRLSAPRLSAPLRLRPGSHGGPPRRRSSFLRCGCRVGVTGRREAVRRGRPVRDSADQYPVREFDDAVRILLDQRIVCDGDDGDPFLLHAFELGEDRLAGLRVGSPSARRRAAPPAR